MSSAYVHIYLIAGGTVKESKRRMSEQAMGMGTSGGSTANKLTLQELKNLFAM